MFHGAKCVVLSKINGRAFNDSVCDELGDLRKHFKLVSFTPLLKYVYPDFMGNISKEIKYSQFSFLNISNGK